MIQKSYDNSPTLYIVPTPIGNMEDITYRAVKILSEVDVIFSEDTRVTSMLLRHFDINKKLISSHLYNENSNCDKEIEYLNEGKNIAVVSDRGTPVIIPALVMSGLGDGPFTFYGFLNNKESKRKSELEDLKEHKFTLVFYEAPHRITKTLENIKQIFGNRQGAIIREISKKYEEVIRGDIDTLIETSVNLKGEIVLIIEGNKEEKDFSDLSILDHINLYLKEGKDSKEAIKLVAKDRGIPKSEVYKEYHMR